MSTVAVGDPVVGLGFGAFGPQMVTREELVAPAPAGFSVTGLATVPSAFVSAALSFELSGLEAGERVLIHAGAGGVGLAAIQLVQAAGAEGLCHCERAEASVSPVTGRGAHIRQPADEFRQRDPLKLRMARVWMWC